MHSCSITRMSSLGGGRAAGIALVSWTLAGLLTVVRPAPARSEDDRPEPNRPVGTPLTPAEERMKADVTFLAADAREGRAPGTKGIEASAEYIADVFKQCGPQAGTGGRRLLSEVPSAAVPRSATRRSLCHRPPGQDPQGRTSDRFIPWRWGRAARSTRSADRLRRLWDHRQGPCD